MTTELFDAWLICGNGDGAIHGVYIVPLFVLNANIAIRAIILRNCNEDGDTIASKCEEVGYDINAFLAPYAIKKAQNGYNSRYAECRIVRIIQPTY